MGYSQARIREMLEAIAYVWLTNDGERDVSEILALTESDLDLARACIAAERLDQPSEDRPSSPSRMHVYNYTADDLAAAIKRTRKWAAQQAETQKTA